MFMIEKQPSIVSQQSLSQQTVIVAPTVQMDTLQIGGNSQQQPRVRQGGAAKSDSADVVMSQTGANSQVELKKPIVNIAGSA